VEGMVGSGTKRGRGRTKKITGKKKGLYWDNATGPGDGLCLTPEKETSKNKGSWGRESGT